MFCVLSKWWWEFFFWSSLFGVFFLYLDRLVFRVVRKFSSMILLKKDLCVSLIWISSPSFLPIICRFHLFIVSQDSWVFCDWIWRRGQGIEEICSCDTCFSVRCDLRNKWLQMNIELKNHGGITHVTLSCLKAVIWMIIIIFLIRHSWIAI